MSWRSFSSSYETVKYVQVQDARLGWLRFVLLVGIALYVGVVEMAYMGGYLEATRVVGATRFSLKQPTMDDCDSSSFKNENCTNAFAPLDTLPYCQQGWDYNEASSSSSSSYGGSVYPCQIYEAVNAQLIRESSIVVWTRASTQKQSLVCDGTNDMTCPRTYQAQNDTNGGPFYIAQSEAFTVLLEHAATASHICESSHTLSSVATPHYACSAQASSYPDSGRMLSLNQNLCQKEFAKNNSYELPHGTKRTQQFPCYIGPNVTSNGHDYFSLDVLLQASGISSLDDCTEKKNSDDCVTTFRESGATVLLTIVWNDFRPYHGLVEPFYFYKPRIIGTSYKESLAFYDGSDYRQSRTLMSAHGVKVAVVIAGNFHQFTWLNFLITVTTALGMLAVATAVVDACMLYIVPGKERYQQVKYETMPQQTATTTVATTENPSPLFDYQPIAEDQERLLELDDLAGTTTQTSDQL